MEASGSPTISVRTLGVFELAIDGRAVERWKAGKARNLLQFLLLRRGRVVSRDVLFESLWPDARWSKDSSLLKVAVHMLRNVLDTGRGGAPDDGAGLRLLTREPGYVLEARDVFVDFETFTRLADAGHAAQLRGDRDAAVDLYRRAAGLYHGDFLPDVPYDWAAAEREWLRSRLLCAFVFLTETALLSGDHVGVLRWCRRILDFEPYHEEAFRALMLVHGHLGQLAQADRWYRLCAARLGDNLHVAPDLATRRIHSRAVRGEFTGRAMDPGSWRRELA